METYKAHNLAASEVEMSFGTLRAIVLGLVAVGMNARQRRRVIEEMHCADYDTVGEAAFWALPCDRDNKVLHDLDGWPKCACTACGCDEPATCTDDGGVEVCATCHRCPSSR